MLQSVRLARWWQAAGFAKELPGVDHAGKGWSPRIPAAILETNSHVIYAAFMRGLFEADGTVDSRCSELVHRSEAFAAEVRTALLALGFPTTTRQTQSGWGGADSSGARPQRRARDQLRELDRLPRWTKVRTGRRRRRLRPVTVIASTFRVRCGWNSRPTGHGPQRVAVVQQGVGRGRGLSRDLAARLYEATGDTRLGHALGYLFETVDANEDGGVQPTYDLSVPDNVTYVAAGFVSHNTIGLMMDCDTTGIEPDLALVKFKKLVGGGSMQIVNQTVPRALRKLGYQEEQVEAIVEYIAEHGHVVDAPGLRRSTTRSSTAPWASARSSRWGTCT